ncbi:MAG: hypothetical protein A2020_05145, partial [Lentisphaerae bacterium GWF2_45_14]
VWLISLSSTLWLLGLYLPSIFVVHILEKIPRKHPILLISGALQRMPVFFAGLALLFLVESHPLFTLYLVALSPFISGFFCGMTYPAWVEFVSKTVPAPKRASHFALRLIIGSLIGLAAGKTIMLVLSKFPIFKGFGILHMITFVLLAASFVVFSMIKETTDSSTLGNKADDNPLSVLRDIPQILRTDKRFLTYLLSLTLLNGTFIALPFLSIHALRVLNKPLGYLGTFVMVMIAGKLSSNFICGWLGDKFGGKLSLSISLSAYAMTFILAAFAGSENIFYLVFFLAGFSEDAMYVGRGTLNVDIAPAGRMVRYQSIITLTSLPAMLAMPLFGAFLWKISGSFLLLSLISAALSFAAFYYLAKIKEPRFN